MPPRVPSHNQPSVAIRTVPPDEPTKRVDMLNVEDIAAQVASDGDVKFCRCWKSANVRAAAPFALTL